jgi:hypothetical protein
MRKAGPPSASRPGNCSCGRPQQPKLYAVELAGADDRVADRIGFRTIATRGKTSS